MRSIEYEGVIYESIKDCCAKLEISYQRVRRLIRHYQRAKDNPAIAIDWVLGKQSFISSYERKTDMYFHDLELTKERMIEYKAQKAEKYLNDVKEDATAFANS